MNPRFRAILRNELLILRGDQPMFLVLILMPLIFMTFMRPVFQAVLRSQGYSGANGTEQAVPGMAVMFAFFIVGNVGFVFFREHTWGTWERLRASPARTGDIMIAKTLPLLEIVLIQQALLFGVGWAFLGLHINGSVLALIVLGLSLALVLVMFGLMVTAMFDRIEHVNLVGTVGAMVFAAFGGALAPIELLPSWAQTVGMVTPTYWAVHGYQQVLLDGAGVADVAPSIAVLAVGALVCGALAVRTFRVEDTKAFWT